DKYAPRYPWLPDLPSPPLSAQGATVAQGGGASLNQRVGQPDAPTAPVRAPEADRLRCAADSDEAGHRSDLKSATWRHSGGSRRCCSYFSTRVKRAEHGAERAGSVRAAPACQRRVFVTTEGDRISEMAVRGTDRQRRPSMNFRPATSGGADRSMWRSASSSAWRHRRCSPWPAR